MSNITCYIVTGNHNQVSNFVKNTFTNIAPIQNIPVQKIELSSQDSNTRKLLNKSFTPKKFGNVTLAKLSSNDLKLANKFTKNKTSLHFNDLKDYIKQNNKTNSQPWYPALSNYLLGKGFNRYTCYYSDNTSTVLWEKK